MHRAQLSHDDARALACAVADRGRSAGSKTTKDRKLISPEIRGWAKSVGVTEQQLRHAVKAVGYSDEAVRSLLEWQIKG